MIMGAIRAWICGGPFCVRISRKLLSITDVATGRKWEDEPLMAISGSGERKAISAIGVAARRVSGAMVVNPFDHPRILVADFLLAEKVLQHGFREVSKFKWISPAPIAVIQILEKLEGGLSQIENRVVRELAAGAGSRAVYIDESAKLSDAEIKNGFYRSIGRS